MTDTPQWIKDAAKKIYGEDFDNWQQVAVAIARHAPKPSASVQERALPLALRIIKESSASPEPELVEYVTDIIAAAFADLLTVEEVFCEEHAASLHKVSKELQDYRDDDSTLYVCLLCAANIAEATRPDPQKVEELKNAANDLNRLIPNLHMNRDDGTLWNMALTKMARLEAALRNLGSVQK